MNEQDKDRLAAELALGTLDASAWERAARLRREDRAFAQAVAEWEARLAPLSEAVPDALPPDSLWRGLEATLDRRADEAGAAADLPQFASLRRRVTVWRGAALALAAILVFGPALIGRFGLPGFEPAGAERFVAMLHNDAGDMGYVVTVEPGQQRVLVRNMGASAPPQKDFELWLMHRTGAEPIGLVSRQGSMTMPLPKTIQVAQLEQDAQVVVCVEPEGGHPSSAPGMGPIVYTGRLVRQTP